MLDRKAKHALSFVVFVMFAALSCGQLFAQMSVTGAVSGTVLDASGSVVPGAAVKLTSETTREARETKSNGEGLFSFTVVPRDSYTHAGSSRRRRTASRRRACSGRWRSARTRRRGRCCTGCGRCWCGRAGTCWPAGERGTRRSSAAGGRGGAGGG